MNEFTPPPPQQGGKKREGPCIVAGCEKPARTRGMCNDHYQRWMKYGDPTAGKWTRGEGIPRDGKSLCPHCGQMVTRSTRLRHQRLPDVRVQGIIRICSVEGCDGQVESRGYCGKHYARWRKHGDATAYKYSEEIETTWEDGKPFVPPAPRVSGLKVKSSCLVPDCEKPVRSRGLCNAHHQRWLIYGDPVLEDQRPRGEDASNWRGGHEDYYGPNWNPQRKKARERDGNCCQDCGKTAEQEGKAMAVHHIVAFRSFGLERYEEANKLTNLICLCVACHMRRERNLPPRLRQIPLDLDGDGNEPTTSKRPGHAEYMRTNHWTPERRKQVSEKMKRIRAEKFWSSRKDTESH